MMELNSVPMTYFTLNFSRQTTLLLYIEKFVGNSILSMDNNP